MGDDLVLYRTFVQLDPWIPHASLWPPKDPSRDTDPYYLLFVIDEITKRYPPWGSTIAK
jgi:hypothetical protein